MPPGSKRPKNKITKVSSIGDLRYRCNNDVNKEKYQKLAIIASNNLGGPANATLDQAFGWLNTNAAETDEDGVVGEINFCISMV